MKKPRLAAPPDGPVLGFVCAPLGARLTRSACGSRHENAGTPWEPGARKVKVWSEQCAKCSLGAAHARGEKPHTWPDGTRVDDTFIVPAQALLRSQPLRRRERLEAF